MKCPVCEESLKPMERQSIEIDYCPKCRGVWLDRGELDKIIERSTNESNAGRKEETGRFPQQYHRSDDDENDHGYKHHGKPRRKESFLSNLFDWD